MVGFFSKLTNEDFYAILESHGAIIEDGNGEILSMEGEVMYTSSQITLSNKNEKHSNPKMSFLNIQEENSDSYYQENGIMYAA